MNTITTDNNPTSISESKTRLEEATNFILPSIENNKFKTIDPEKYSL